MPCSYKTESSQTLQKAHAMLGENSIDLAKMELIKVSKFKLRLRSLVAEVRELRDREHAATEQIHLSIQKQKETEEKLGRKLTELQAELALSNDLRQQLERKVSCLQNDNSLLENKQKELRGTINSLLQSRENFIKVYEDSTCEMRRSIEIKDRKLAILHEKINAQISLFDSIEKEALSVKQAVSYVQDLVHEKEEVVAGLRSKMDEVSTFEKIFVERISDLENKLRDYENELGRKNKLISELEEQLEAARINNICQLQIEELQKTISVKEMVIRNLISEKKVLHFEVGSLGIISQKIQDAVANMNEEDKRLFSSKMGEQTVHAANKEQENIRIEDVVRNSSEMFPNKAPGRETAENTAATRLCQEYNPVNGPLQENNNFGDSVSEFACTPSQPSRLGPQSPANAISNSVTEAKDNCTASVQQLDSQSSTTHAETSKDPD